MYIYLPKDPSVQTGRFPAVAASCQSIVSTASWLATRTISLPLAIRAAVCIARITLNDYYSKTDLLDMCRIAIGELFHFACRFPVVVARSLAISSCLLLVSDAHVLTLLFSATPWPQARLLQGAWLGGRVDRHGS